ncbi:bifunctional riboflavin kinase/FMN adenylyltransferase [Spiroplasma helicoides]|uniref:FAD synthase n=1 Tax=Spiroplasma helicoides TaxID=216938 RepID=A0A1B3SK55_9MOLU|nr:hypothetical protein [Spiroplasma helicoides]AOG60305.1 bifunctional riboflavin kinase/FMN adenylyltransferase [Spiroplasma helicoides]
MLKKNIFIDKNEAFSINNKNVVCIGFFDGVHKLHQKVIEKTKQIAELSKLSWSIITFSEKINNFLENKPNNLQAKNLKYKFFEDVYNPDFLFEIQVNNDTIHINKNEFISYLKTNLNVAKVVVGSDFNFGFKGEGNVQDLTKAFGQENVFVFERVQEYSSTQLKNLLMQGKIKELNEKMGHNYELQVVKIDKNEYKIIDSFVSIMDGWYLLEIDKKNYNAKIQNNTIYIEFDSNINSGYYTFNLLDKVNN